MQILEHVKKHGSIPETLRLELQNLDEMLIN